MDCPGCESAVPGEAESCPSCGFTINPQPLADRPTSPDAALSVPNRPPPVPPFFAVPVWKLALMSFVRSSGSIATGSGSACANRCKFVRSSGRSSASSIAMPVLSGLPNLDRRGTLPRAHRSHCSPSYGSRRQFRGGFPTRSGSFRCSVLFFCSPCRRMRTGSMCKRLLTTTAMAG